MKKYQEPEYDLTIVCNVKECIRYLASGKSWDIVSLDFDLEGYDGEPWGDRGSRTAWPVFRFLADACKSLVGAHVGKIIIHSARYDMYDRIFDTINQNDHLYEIIFERFVYDD